MYFTGATVAGSPDVPNEDWVATTSDLIVVLDGATIRTETGCRHGAAWYTRKLGAAVIEWAAVRSMPLEKVLWNAINDVSRLHEDECDLGNPGTPSAAVGIVRLDDDMLRYLVLGDVTIVVAAPDGITVVSDQRISASAAAERAEVDRHLIGSPDKASALVTMKHAELAARNTEGGYWIAAASPGAAHHAIVGEVPMSSIRRLAVLTDGAARYVDLFGRAGWDDVLTMLAGSGPRWLLDRVIRPIENADPLGARFPRNKCSDDASVVFAQLADRIVEGVGDVTPQAMDDACAALLTPMSSPTIWGDGMKQAAEAERAAGLR